jgi:hypothetical protein
MNDSQCSELLTALMLSIDTRAVGDLSLLGRQGGSD